MGKKTAKLEGERARVGFDRQGKRKAPLFSDSINVMRVFPSDLNIFVINKESEVRLFECISNVGCSHKSIFTYC